MSGASKTKTQTNRKETKHEYSVQPIHYVLQQSQTTEYLRINDNYNNDNEC